MSILAPTSVAIRYGYRYDNFFGFGSGSYSGGGDILFQRAASPTFPLSDGIVSAAKVSEYFNGANGAYNATAIWSYVPLMESNYRSATIVIYNNLGVNLNITAYLIHSNVALYGLNPLSVYSHRVIGKRADSPHVLGYSGGANVFEIGVGAISDDSESHRIATDWIGGGLLISMTPASDPTTGYTGMTVMRAR